MALIEVKNLTFSYPGCFDIIFDDVSFSIDTNWKLGFIGRNGKGKTTFLNLLMDKYEYQGTINSVVDFDYFPFEISNPEKTPYEIACEINPDLEENYEYWKIDKEVSLLGMDPDQVLNSPFNTLSKGEQTKILLAILFTKDNKFLLIDEPTNHLDSESRKMVANYLNSKSGFILVSHDRNFLDNCIDHVLSINKNNIEVQKGNFSSWQVNKERQETYELSENEKLKKDISKLEESAKKTAVFAQKTENKKFRNLTQSDNRVDKGFIGKKSAKMMKRSINAQNRKERAIEEKALLLKNVDKADNLKLNMVDLRAGVVVEIKNLSISYDGNEIFDELSFVLEKGDRLQLKGVNGCGKSSILKLILGYDLDYNGELYKANNLLISYVSQDTSKLKGNLTKYANENMIDESLFKTILSKLDFSRNQFEKNIEDFSEGQKKKVLIAKSLTEQANMYIWDEPLNYIDVLSRIQIEDVILKYEPTMIFVEHDESFANNIATKVVNIKKKDYSKVIKK